MESWNNIKKTVKKAVTIAGVTTLSMNPMDSEAQQTRSYESIATERHIKTVDHHEKELTDILKIPTEKQEAVASFLQILNQYHPGMTAHEISTFLENVNSKLAQFSDFHIEISQPLPKDKIKEDLLLLKGSTPMIDSKGGVHLDEKKYFILKNKTHNQDKWMIYGSYFNRIDNYRSIGELEAIFMDKSSIGVSPQSSNFIYIKEIIPSADWKVK